MAFYVYDLGVPVINQMSWSSPYEPKKIKDKHGHYTRRQHRAVHYKDVVANVIILGVSVQYWSKSALSKVFLSDVLLMCHETLKGRLLRPHGDETAVDVAKFQGDVSDRILFSNMICF